MFKEYRKFAPMRRRGFLASTGLGFSGFAFPHLLLGNGSNALGSILSNSGREESYDAIIVGGGLGGCAAAMELAKGGHRVLMTEETDWIGGQLTQQAVPPDEHRWIEQVGSPTYRRLREMVRDYYRRNYPLTEAARKKPNLNPGNGSVSLLCHEPRVALAVLYEMLAPFLSNGTLSLWLQTEAIEAETKGDQILAIKLRSEGRERWCTAKYFIDATEQGDLLPISKTEFVIGAESREATGEPHASAEANPRNVQSFAHCFAMDYLENEDHTIDKPKEYDFWKEYVPDLKPAWSGKLLSLRYSSPRDLQPKDLDFIPETVGKATPKTKGLNLWMYRRILDPSNFTPGSYRGGITIVNWPQNDYFLGDLIHGTAEEIAKHREGGKQLSLSFFYWLQTEAPRPDGNTGWKGLRLRGDVVGTQDGLAKYPYIRESRRIQAEFTILEQHIAKKSRESLRKSDQDTPKAESFADSVGIGSYHLDLHPSTAGDNYIDFESLPFEIPLGALIPKRVDNLIAACKNIGTTHISNGCYRLHPVEWSIGEAAGALAAMSLETKELPRGIRGRTKSLEALQQRLISQGVPLKWP